MLKDFFHLNEGFKVLTSESELLELLNHADSIKDILFKPDLLAPPRPHNKIQDKTFTNVSLSKKVIQGVEFKRCVFIDCLFIGTKFESCEFHYCTFEGCNPYKASFSKTYINPEVFAKILDPKRHSNIGVWLFQQLMQNSAECQQPEYTQTAQYHFKKWLRYQMSYEYSQGRTRPSKTLGTCQYLRNWLPSFLYDHLAGYGIRLLPFVRLTLVMILAVTAINYLYWDTFGMNTPRFITDTAPVSQAPANPIVRPKSPAPSDGVAQEPWSIQPHVRSWVEPFYFTVITMTTVGYGDITPHSRRGMLAASAEALLGLMWLGTLASFIFKRVSK
jgi:hypothetical protein